MDCGLRTNRPNWNFVRADIRQQSPSDALNVADVKPYVIIECFPCDSSSLAGKQRAIKDPPGKV